jgi:hypothetical protein
MHHSFFWKFQTIFIIIRKCNRYHIIILLSTPLFRSSYRLMLLLLLCF